MPSQMGVPGRTGRLTALYVAIWGVLAVGAALYLGGLAIRADLLPSLAAQISTQAQTAQTSEPDVARAISQVEGLGRSVADLRAEVGNVKEALARQDERVREVPALQAEVGEIKTALAGQEERQRNLSGRLAAFEAQAMAHAAATQAAAVQPSVSHGAPGGIVTGSVEERADPAARMEPKAAKPSEEHKAAKASEDPKPAKASEPRSAERKPAVQQTASASAVPPFGPAKVVALSGPVALQLGTGSSPDDLRLKWLRLTSSSGGMLQRFEPRYAESKGGAAPLYRLIIGPIANSDEASRLCNQLKAKKLSCSVTAVAGQPL